MPLKLSKPGGAKPAGKPGLKLGGNKPPKASSPFGSGPRHQTGAVFGQSRAERKKQELNRLRPWNLKVPVGGSMEVYIVDKGDPWARYQHKIGGGPNSSGRDYPCLKATNEQCPLCTREGKEGSYVMYLTCVVPRETYEKSDGTSVTRRFAKKLFPITVKMQGKYERLFEQHGNLRGAVLKVSRDNKLDPSTGNDVEFVRRLTEAEIAKFATAAGFSGETKDQIIKSKIGEPFDYDKVMPTPKAKELSAMVGMKGSGGGIGGADFDGGDDDDEGGFGNQDDWGAGD